MKKYTNLKALYLLSIFLCSACTHNYIPNEYVISEDRIDKIEISGDTEVTNIQPTDEPIEFSMGLHTYKTTTKIVGEALTTQLKNEIKNRGFSVKDGGEKLLHITVRDLTARVGFVAFKCNMLFTVAMGNNKQKEFSVDNTSPANIDRALNGTIARGVMAILNDPEVRSYLK